MTWWPEFLTLALVHLLAVASPEPDFAMALRIGFLTNLLNR